MFLQKLKGKNKGITIIETLIYTVIFSVAFLVMVQSVISIVRTHRLVKIKQSLESSGVISMERILREIRNASSVDIADSVLGSSPGRLTLNGTDENNNAYTVTFRLSGGAVQISKDGGPFGNLSEASVNVDSLIFRQLATDDSSGVRVELLLSAPFGGETKNLDLFGFAIIRNSY